MYPENSGKSITAKYETLEDSLKKLWFEKGFALNIPIIDLQHIWLLWLLMKLETETIKGDSQHLEVKVNYIQSELISYISDHFTLEEEMLDHYGYPDSELHKFQHIKYIESISIMIQSKNLTFGKLYNNMQFLENWLYGHILVEDAKYKKYFANNSINTNPFFDKAVKEDKSVNISRSQAELYNHIYAREIMAPAVNTNIIRTVTKLWLSNSLATRIQIIDIQHLWLIKIIVELENGSKSDSRKEREDAFKKAEYEIYGYVRNHFKTEEAILQRMDFPGAKTHAAQHRLLVDNFEKRINQKRDGVYTVNYALISDLKEWLISHVAVEDKGYSYFFKDKVDKLKECIAELKREGMIGSNIHQFRFYHLVKKNMQLQGYTSSGTM